MNKWISVASIFLMLPCIVFAKGFASLGMAREAADKAMSHFVEEEITEGYDLLKPYWPLPSVEIDNLANQTSTQWPLVRNRFGRSIGTEFIEKRRAGKSFARFTYLQKFNHHAIRWVFTLYKPTDKWVINAVSFDDQINRLF